MKRTKINATVKLEGELEGEYSTEDIQELLENRVVVYFPDDEPVLKGNIGISKCMIIHVHKEEIQ